MQFFATILAAVVVGTWNARWFPSGDPDRRPSPETEARTIAEAGRLLARGIAAVDPAGTNDVILCLNEVRVPKAVRELAAAIGRTNMTVAIVSDYRWNGGRSRQKQQDAILTTLPVAAKNWSVWKSVNGIRPPRGYAHADLILAPAVTASVYAVHLKSNYGVGSDAKARADNRAKRGVAVRQVVSMTKPVARARGRRISAKDVSPVIVAGDFNADPLRAEFRDETLFPDLAKAGFRDLLTLLPPAARGTHPSEKFGDSALDHIFVRGLESAAKPCVLPAGDLSDHNPVFAVVSH